VCLLGGGNNLGIGAQACRHMLERSKLRSDWFIVEGTHQE
jgi:hypothetical protein